MRFRKIQTLARTHTHAHHGRDPLRENPALYVYIVLRLKTIRYALGRAIFRLEKSKASPLCSVYVLYRRRRAVKACLLGSIPSL